MAGAVATHLLGCGDEVPETNGTTTTTTSSPPELPPPLDPLPAVEPTKTEQLATGGTCAQCHLAGDSPVMHDAGEDVSPVHLWRSSMMAFAAKDPYYLAVLGEARAARPEAAEVIDAACLRCHAPAGSVEAASTGAAFGFEDLVSGTSAAAHLGRDGVTCSLCHQIRPDNLGQTESLSGGFEIGFDREMFGPHQGPSTQPMEFFVNYTPVYSEHIGSSDLCGTCHTVVVPFLDAGGAPTGDGFLEQATYLEWLNSEYSTTAPCAQCHLPTSGADGLPFSSPISKYPEGLQARSPFGRHTFEGGNAYMLSVLADEVAWTGSEVAAGELMAAAARGQEHLGTAAELSIPEAELVGPELHVVVEVQNRTGHKLPTGYPSRRMWLHVVAEGPGGEVLFESGKPGEHGAIESGGARVDLDGVVVPHLDEVGPGEAQVFEAVAVDAAGEPTHRPLAQVRLGKDNRILPEGWSDGGPWASWTAPEGVSGDASFIAGRDRTTYRIPNGAAVKRVTAELLYQTLPRTVADALAVTPVPAAVRFSRMAAARPPAPVTMATVTWE